MYTDLATIYEVQCIVNFVWLTKFYCPDHLLKHTVTAQHHKPVNLYICNRLTSFTFYDPTTVL